jgi:hypothetical protein
VTIKYFNVKNGLLTGNITLNAGNGNVVANTFVGNLSVTGLANLGSFSNVKILGGSTGQVLSTDGTGNLSWITQSGGSGVTGSIVLDSFSGTGEQTEFILSTVPTSENYTIINIDGVSQLRTSYSLSGNIITFSSPPADGAVIEVMTFNIGSDGGGTLDSFNGNGEQTSFTLSTTPASEDYTIINIDGVLQLHTSYSLSGNVITFTAPPTDGSVIEVMTYNLGSGGGTSNVVVAGSNTQIQFNDDGNLGASENLTFNKTTNTFSTGNVVANSISVTGNITLTDTVTANNANISNVLISGNTVTTGNLRTDNLQYANGTAYVFTTNAAGSNTQVQFNTDNAFSASTNFTFNTTTNTLSVTNIIANGNQLTNLNASNVIGTVGSSEQANVANIANSVSGSNVSGQVSNASIAGTVYTNAQPNITSVGTLTDLSVTGNTSTGNLRTDNLQYSNGSPYVFTSNAAGANTQIQFNDANSFAGSANLTFDKTTNTLSVTNIIANGNQLTNINASNISGQVANALVAGTVYTNAQPNITSLGTLTDLSVSGNAVIGGNLTVSGNLKYINVETLAIQDPIIELGGGPNNTPLTTNDGKDRGTLLHYYTTEVVDAFMGWDNSNGEFAFGSNVSIASEVVTFNSLGNVRASYFLGNGSQLTGVTATTATTAETVTTNAQPNITSLGTLANLTVDGIANLSNVGNVKITGGANGQVLSTDGVGNLSWIDQSAGGGNALNITVNEFTGDGTNTSFTLSSTPTSENFTIATIGGTVQPKTVYSLSGNVITFSSPPPNNSIIEVSSFVGSAPSSPSTEIINGTSNLSIATSNGNITATVNGTSNVLSISSSNIVIKSNILPSTANTYSLGSEELYFKDVYIGPGSLYINGQKVLEQAANTIVVSADLNQSVRLSTSGTGRIELLPTGTGVIQVDGTLQIVAGRSITSSDGNAVRFDNPISVNEITSLTSNGQLVLTGDGTGNVKVNDDLVVTGNLLVQGNTANLSVNHLTVQDNIIELNAESTGIPNAEINSGIRVIRGELSSVVMRWNESLDRWQFTNDGSNYLSLLGNDESGNIQLGTNAIATTFVGNLSGNATSATTAGTVTTNAQPNITSVGLLTSLSVGPNSSITLTGTSGFVRANSIQGTDGVNAIFPGYNSVSGRVGIQTDLYLGVGGTGNLVANTGNAIFGSNANVKISGGTSGQVLGTDGLGNLSWITPTGGGNDISVSSNGSQLTSSVESFNFTGNGVSVTNTANAVTVEINSGGGGGGITAGKAMMLSMFF